MSNINQLFVYGIFLDERNRKTYGMSNPRYETVEGYATKGGHIVTAYPTEGYTLTGLVVDVDPRYWGYIDMLEAHYDRAVVKTTSGTDAYMYVGRVSNTLSDECRCDSNHTCWVHHSCMHDQDCTHME